MWLRSRNAKIKLNNTANILQFLFNKQIQF
jgi:hypothetical protein